MRGWRTLISFGVLCWASLGCKAAPPEQINEAGGAPGARFMATATIAVASSSPRPLTPTAVHTSTPSPTSTATATPSPSLTPSLTPTPPACEDRVPVEEDLLTLVTRQFGLSRDYVPSDLVPLADFFPNSVTLGYPTEVRLVVIDPLQKIVGAMHEDGLSPQIISGFRSFSAQALALQKWVDRYPEWARNLSAPPGHSEHQLGTTVDFGSPELPEMVGEEKIQFHPAFSRTSEGIWLSEKAHKYGFTMSYPADAVKKTEFSYEPWHFRYVGRTLATSLKEQELTISEYLLQRQPQPCLP